MPHSFKRGQRIEYTFAAGKVVQGKVKRLYSASEIAAHAKSHGAAAAARLPEWLVCQLTDEAGTFTVACHHEQLRLIDNR